MLNEVFSNVEKKLKLIAKVNFVCGIICVGLFALLGILSDGFVGLLKGLLIGALFLLSVTIIAWFYYAFAELVENVKAINGSLKTNYTAAQTKLVQPKSTPVYTSVSANAQKKKVEEAQTPNRTGNEEKTVSNVKNDVYWKEHSEEKAALLKKREDVAEKLSELDKLTAEQVDTLVNLMEEINETLREAGEE